MTEGGGHMQWEPPSRGPRVAECSLPHSLILGCRRGFRGAQDTCQSSSVLGAVPAGALRVCRAPALLCVLAPVWLGLGAWGGASHLLGPVPTVVTL